MSFCFMGISLDSYIQLCNQEDIWGGGGRHLNSVWIGIL